MKKQSDKVNSAGVEALRKMIEKKSALLKLMKRELEIEASLEKVRARTMAMQRSDELQQIVNSVFESFMELKVTLATANIIIFSEDSKDVECWTANDTLTNSSRFLISYADVTILNDIAKAKQTGQKLLAKSYSVKEKNELFSYFFEHTDYRNIPADRRHAILESEHYALSLALIKNIGVQITSYAKPSFSGKENEILTRFANIFYQAYVRFLDLQKAETQAREAQIEAALEKVRSRSLAMHKSDELQDVVRTVFDRLNEVDIVMNAASIFIFREGSDDLEQWVALSGHQYSTSFHLPYCNLPMFRDLKEARQKKKDTLVKKYSFDEKNDWFRFAFEHTDYRQLSDERKKYLLESDCAVFAYALTKNTGLQLANYEGELFSETGIEILKRFAKVFEQAYTRFLDLQKAEAQAREAKIEAALEKVRSRSLAMYETKELNEVVTVVFEKLQELGIALDSGGAIINIFIEGSRDVVQWIASHDLSSSQSYYIPYFDHPIFVDLWNAQESGLDFFSRAYSYEEKNSMFKKFFEYTDYKHFPDDFKERMLQNENYSIAGAWSKHSAILIPSHTGALLPEEQKEILKRFTKVFEQAYVRFLDLQKAETQAREAQIEAALERVRAKTMAMHKSEQLSETAKVFFEQFNSLGKIPDRMSIGIINEESKKVELWVTDQTGNEVNQQYFFSLDERTSISKIYSAWMEKKDTIIVDLAGQDLHDWLQFVREEARLPVDETKIKGRRVQQAAFFAQGFLLFTTHEPVANEIMKLLVRFARVFDQTYTRFLDLQKAEAQARGAQIEAALERVRTQTMAMNKSHDLQEVVSVIFSELDKLELKTLRCGIGIINGTDRSVDVWTTATAKDGYEVNFSGNESMDIHPLLQEVFCAWQNQEDYYYVLEGEELVSYYNTQKGDNYKIPDAAAGATVSHSDRHYYFNTFFPAGGLFFFREIPFTEELINIIRRFANAFGLAYKRFEDLKQSEARALEAIRESSLDRVRAEIASMRTINDLQRITPLIWRELTVLGVPFFRCGVFIIDEVNAAVKFYLSAPDGHSLGVMNLAFNVNSLTMNAVENWRKGQVYTEHWNKEAFTSWMQSMIEEGQIPSKEIYQDGAATAPESLDLHLVPFAQGMLYVGNDSPLQKEKLDLIKSLAEAFSIAYARYEDFNKLELAKQQIEKTLVDLKQAQSQLIQSEKMASLGELTAGIAHEIQNPLNFVNNFSEVNKELLEEMKGEIEKGNTDEVKAIANALIENEEKINHHGKRADAIVKGMLQHSRANTGQKELTDINKLADEYLRLSYHGLRAKDKTFNATMPTDFDETIGNINIVPQDIGRVLLNLYNNAFYAVNKKIKSTDETYQPTVSVQTKKLNDKVEIIVSDTGNGIPKKIVDKIFQPFFTTKPAGQGTGLGLSLSYDIIKAHGGELKVETKEGEGSEFIISLPIK